MRPVKILGIAVVAALIGAALFAGTASAVELCKAAESECSEENLYGEGTKVVAKATKAEIGTSLGTITCASAIEDEIKVETGIPMPLEVSGFSFTECKTGETKCTTKTLHLPFYSSLEQTTGDAGTLTIVNWGEGTPEVTFECASVMNCTFGTEELALTFKGGEKATMEASKASLSVVGGKLCPKSPSLTASYTVQSPAPAHAAARVVSSLCTVAPTNNNCAPNNRYTGNLEIELASTPAKIKTATPAAEIVCEEAPMSGAAFDENGSGTLSLELYTGGLICSSTLPMGNPGVAVTVAPSPMFADFYLTRAFAGYVVSSGAGPRTISLTLEYAVPVACQYNVTRPLWRIAAYGPMKIKSLWIATRVGNNTTCPLGLEIEAEHVVKRPAGGGNLWLGRKM